MRDSRNIRKIFALFMALCMIFAFSACTGSGGKAPDSDNANNDKKTEVKSDDKKASSGEIKIDDCVAVYKGFEIKKDSDDEDAIIVKYDFTNNSDTEESFDWGINPKYYQNGVELAYAVVRTAEDSFDAYDDDTATNIRKGATIEVASTYKLKDLKSPVDVVCESVLGDDRVEFQIDITK